MKKSIEYYEEYSTFLLSALNRIHSKPNKLIIPMSLHPGEVKRRKTCLIAIIDDHSRLIRPSQFYRSEKSAFYPQALEQAVLKRVLP